MASINFLLDQRFHKIAGLKGHQVIGLLAYTHEFHRDLQRIRHSNHDAALGRAIQLGQGDGGDTGDLLKLLSWIKPF